MIKDDRRLFTRLADLALKSSSWGYYPSGGLGLILIIVLILVLMGRDQASGHRHRMRENLMDER